MSVESHTADIFAKEFLHLPEPVRRAAMEFARLAEEICRSDRQGMDIAEIEQHVVSAVAATGLMLLKGLIEERDDGAGSIRHAGKTWHRVAPSRGTVTCLLGKLEYVRPLYRCRSERRSLCPVDDSLGLLPVSMTQNGTGGRLPAARCPSMMRRVSACRPSVRVGCHRAAIPTSSAGWRIGACRLDRGVVPALAAGARGGVGRGHPGDPRFAGTGRQRDGAAGTHLHVD